MGPDQEIPLPPAFTDTECYVESLLNLISTDALLRLLCGGVHILDFFTSEPGLYTRIFPEEWREFFDRHEMMDLLDFFMRDDLDHQDGQVWKGETQPPDSLLRYIRSVRTHLLSREPMGSQCSRNRALKPTQKMARHVTVGMNIKKVHEVGLFAHYLNHLTEELQTVHDTKISHLVDFGSGQNYLGRALASRPYNQRIVAIESRSHNAERAKKLDIVAKLATKEKVIRNKKAFRGLAPERSAPEPTPDPAEKASAPPESISTPSTEPASDADGSVEVPTEGTGLIKYIEHRIQDGDLGEVIPQIDGPDPNLLVMSLHSCGNLVHHGLRSLLLNPSVKAVAMVGCCYNLVTERLGPATHKLPELRPTTYTHGRLHRLGNERDPHGFPMSRRLCEYKVPSQARSDDPAASAPEPHERRDQSENLNAGEAVRGIRLNITARMMAVQAPSNWNAHDSEGFFTRHFYRALLQRVFLDRGVVGSPTPDAETNRDDEPESSARTGPSGGTPIVIGSLRKGCYASFVLYVRGALEKLCADEVHGAVFREKMGNLADEEIMEYERRYAGRKKELSVTWSLMAFSAGVVEAIMVVDRWSWLKEQDAVQQAWVEPVFDYAFSPRNLVVVGIKK